MIETPAQFNDDASANAAQAYPAANLRTFSYHTGGPVQRLKSDEPCPILFRDLGLRGMRLFLQGKARRLCGAHSPVTYLRSAEYREPYQDFGRIGRLVFLRPMLLHPWHAGSDHVFVAPQDALPDPDSFAVAPGGFGPGEASFSAIAGFAASLRSHHEFREVLGGKDYDAAIGGTRDRIEQLQSELDATEVLAAPLRRALQSADTAIRESAREELARLALTEDDLCAAWHHLPDARRAAVRTAIPEVNRELLARAEGAIR